MRNVGSSDAAALVVDWEDDRTPMPDAAIRATSDIMRQCAQSTQQLMALAGSGGLNIVLNGSNPAIERSPQKISRFNGDTLAAVGNLASGLAEVPEEAGSDNPETPPATNDVAPPPTPAQKAEEPAAPSDPPPSSVPPDDQDGDGTPKGSVTTDDVIGGMDDWLDDVETGF